MSGHQYYYSGHQPFATHTSGQGNHHRSRRSTRYSTSQNSNKHAKNLRSQKEAAEAAHLATLRREFEAARSFELEDDEIFCPFHLLTEDDIHSLHSSSSERSSSSSGSPDASPMQHQLQPTAAYGVPPATHTAVQMAPFHQSASGHLKIHQPLAQRARAIPIVDPNSRTASPPTSISPAAQAQKTAYMSRRGW